MAKRGRGIIGDDSLENWEWLCAGGFGLVYKANHKDLGIEVAIKLPNSGDGTAALCQEADYMEAADHQYVPRVYGMYRGRPPNMGSKERQGIVMELMEGGSLKTLLQTLSKPPPWPLAFRLARQVAQAMDFLHSMNGLVHMDLKPDNILLDANLNAKIADFGLSTVSSSVKETAGKGEKGCTPAFTPPEAFRDDYHRVRSYDVYSYGIILWTILTGESPYPGTDHSLVAFRIQKGDRPDLHKIDVQKAAGLEDLVDLMKRCWDPEPKKRPLFGECVEVTSRVFSKHEEGIDTAVCKMLKQLDTDSDSTSENMAADNVQASGPAVSPGSTNREDFLKHSSPLSLDPNTVNKYVILSENNRKATHTKQPQRYADHPQRFAYSAYVLSRESLSDPCYFEVEWSGERVNIAVSYKDINRKQNGLPSCFGGTDMSWVLWYNYTDAKRRHGFSHNDIDTELSGPVSFTGRDRVGVFVNQREGLLCFYEIHGDRMMLLHTERTSFTRGPLYAGIGLGDATAEVCEIW